MRRRGVDRFATGTDGRARLDVLRAINQASTALRHGFDAAAAKTVAQSVHVILGADGVAVSDGERIVARAGDLPPTELLESHVVHHRSTKPTMVHLGDDHHDLIVGELVVDGAIVASVAVNSAEATPRVVREFGELLRLFSSQVEFAELERARSHAIESELRALRAQVSPHFVHNSLAAIAGCIHDDPERARDLLASFAELLRASFRGHNEFVTVGDELRLSEVYLELERARFGDGRLQVTLQIDPEVVTAKLPVLTLQPLIENAVRHGLEQRQAGGRVRITGRDLGAEIELVVEDDGVGTDPVALDDALRGTASTRHIGVLAVDQRLRSAFGDEFGLTISTAPGAGTEVIVRIPKTLTT